MDSFEDFQAAADDGQEWRIDFDGGETRETTLAAMAWFATKDEDATVTEL